MKHLNLKFGSIDWRLGNRFTFSVGPSKDEVSTVENTPFKGDLYLCPIRVYHFSRYFYFCIYSISTLSRAYTHVWRTLSPNPHWKDTCIVRTYYCSWVGTILDPTLGQSLFLTVLVTVTQPWLKPVSLPLTFLPVTRGRKLTMFYVVSLTVLDLYTKTGFDVVLSVVWRFRCLHP